jgi:salicylate hydroxylase
VIGADGIHSSVRVCLFGPSKPVFTGCIAWRGLIPMEKLPPRLARMVGMNWLGPHGNVLNYPVRRGELMNFVSMSERDDWQVESWSTVGTREELRNDFRDWHADVQLMIDQIETPYKWAMMIREPMAAWSKGRVTLLGDACHPTLPFLGQGGVMSIEDGYVVAACLDKYFGEPGVAFARYEDIRRERTSMVVRKASENKASAFAPNLADKTGLPTRSRVSGSRSACGSGWTGCITTTPPRLRSDRGDAERRRPQKPDSFRFPLTKSIQSPTAARRHRDRYFA